MAKEEGAGLSRPILRVQDLEISVNGKQGKTPLVEGMDFSLYPGETLTIAGESGSGKSLTSLAIMRLLGSNLDITKGKIELDGEDLASLSDTKMRLVRGNRIAMIFQEPMTSLNPVMSIGAQLTEVILAHASLSKQETHARAIEALRAVRISQPENRLKQYPHQLSGGMRQRVMIAMALALKPEVLIADEPTTALDVTVQREVLDLLRDLQKEMGTAIILITHDMGVVAEMSDRVIIMQRGKKVEEGSADDIFFNPKEPYTQRLLAAVPRIGSGKTSASQSSKSDGLVAQLRDVSVRFDIRGGVLNRVQKRVHAVEHVSFDIREKETFALVGESGCGKSTIARAMVGLVPFKGNIEIAGQELSTLGASERQAMRQRIQFIFQDPMAALDARVRVGDLIAEPLLIHNIGTAETRRETAAELMKRVGLSEAQLNRYPHEFSGGQRQRVCIARALALKPQLIIADESVSALDVSVQARVLDLLEELKQEFGISYLFISHDMAVIENIADRVAVMYLGQIVEIGTKAQIFTNPQHPYTKRLIDAVPIPDPRAELPKMERLTGEVPTPVYPLGQGPKRVEYIDKGEGHLVAIE